MTCSNVKLWLEAVCLAVTCAPRSHQQLGMPHMATIPQSDDELEMEAMETSQIWESNGTSAEGKVSRWFSRVRPSFMVPVFGLMVLSAFALRGVMHGQSLASPTAQDLQAEDIQEFKIPALPANPIDVLKANAKAPLTKFKAKWGINDVRGDQIAICVINLNLGAWKLVQLGAIITKTVSNCPAGFDNIDKKIACNINIAAIIVTLSEMMAFFTSTSIVCTGKTNPDARCTVFMALTFRHLALFAAAENQIALFCPKASYQQTVVQGGVRTFDAAERRLLANSSSFAARELSDGSMPPIEQVFCAWNIAEAFWFLARIPPLADIARRRCPAKRGREAACSEAGLLKK